MTLPGRCASYFTLVLLSFAGVLAAPAIGAAPQYTLTDLAPLPPVLGLPMGVNSHGIAVGYMAFGDDGLYNAFLHNGATQDLGTLGGDFSIARGVNSAGVVVGTAGLPSGNQHAFKYDTLMHDLGTLGGPASDANGINGNGTIVGTSYINSVSAERHLFTYDTTMHDLGTMINGRSTFGNAINDAGRIVGSAEVSNTTAHAYVYDGTYHDLGALGGVSFSSAAFGINNFNQIVGVSEKIGGARHAFMYDTSMHDLGTLGGTTSAARGINSSGQIVGTSRTATSNLDRAFLYTPGIGMQDLNSMISPSLLWHLDGAMAINDSGQIIGYGTHGTEYHAFLLTPVPEPSTLVLVAIAGVALLRVGRRARRYRPN